MGSFPNFMNNLIKYGFNEKLKYLVLKKKN